MPVKNAGGRTDTLYLKPPSQFVGFLDRFQPVVTIQHALGFAPFQARFSNHVEECLALADVQSLREVGPKQRLHDYILNTFLVGQPDKPVGVQGVRGPPDPVEGEMNALYFADSTQLGVEFKGSLPASELPDAIFLAADAFFRHRRIELEGEPAHFKLPIKSSDGLLQPPFAYSLDPST